MIASWEILLFLPVGLALLVGLFSTVLAWEAHRYRRSRGTELPEIPRSRGLPRVLVVAPCKGLDDDLAENLCSLFEQSYPNYQIRFVVEDSLDPACHVLKMLQEQYSDIESEIVVAGHCQDSGQKVHNLIAATRQLPERVQILAFVDADACPDENWLWALTHRMHLRSVGARTGYRWYLPAEPTLPNLLVSSINAAVAGSLNKGRHTHIWGGSWAICRDVFEQTRLIDAWQGTLSDDLVASRVIYGAGLKVEFEPHALTASPLSMNWTQAIEFLQRQYIIVRRYAPACWGLGVSGAVLGQLGLWLGLAGGIAALAAGSSLGWLALAVIAAVYALAVFRAVLRQKLGERFSGSETPAARTARCFDMYFAPLAGLVNLFLVLGSMPKRTIIWRNVRYRIDNGGRILQLGRLLDAPLSRRSWASVVDRVDKPQTPRPHPAPQPAVAEPAASNLY